MPSTFLGLNTGLSGLNYFQNALNTTSHNISNSNTKGYSRQQVLASASNPLSVNRTYGMMGTGVTATGIERLRNTYYDNKYWNCASKYTKYGAQFDNLSQLQGYTNEISSDTGYTQWLSKMSDALQDFADNPSDSTTRISYSLTADSFTDMINEIATNFQSTQKSINDEIELVISDINSLAEQIYELTQQIISVEIKGGSANDLRDMRGVCLDRLSEYASIEVEEHSIMFGSGVDAVPGDAKTMSVRINGFLLVDEMECKQLMVLPRAEKINQSDIDGLVDIYWQCPDGTPGDAFNVTKYGGRLAGLFDIRDGNNGEVFSGTIDAVSNDPPSASVTLPKSIHIDKLNIPSQGIITLNGKDYMYDGWTAEYDEDGNLNHFTFLNMTMHNEKREIVPAVFSDRMTGFSAMIGESNSVKGIPYYQARLTELVRTFSKYMNDLTTAGVDANGDPGLDMYTALRPDGADFVLKDSMTGTGTLSSLDDSYYRLDGLNWELNSAWKEDTSKLVVSYARDIEQGDIERRPILDAMIFGMTDAGMFQQGTVHQFLQAMTTNLAVDIQKTQVFMENHDDILYTIDNQRKSISGVDENEEASDLVKFEQLYNLASKVISVLNEVYDKLINDTGI